MSYNDIINRKIAIDETIVSKRRWIQDSMRHAEAWARNIEAIDRGEHRLYSKIYYRNLIAEHKKERKRLRKQIEALKAEQDKLTIKLNEGDFK